MRLFCFSVSAMFLSVVSFFSMVSSWSWVSSSSRVFSVSFWRMFRSVLLFSVVSWMFSVLLVLRVIVPCLMVGISFSVVCSSWVVVGSCVTFSPRHRVCLV